MSTSEPKDRTTEQVEAKSTNDCEKVAERCGTARTSKLPTQHARSLSISGLKSKIPTNIGHSTRSGSTVQSQPQPVDDGTIGKASSTNSGGLPTSKSLTAASSPSIVTKTNKSANNSTGNSTMHSRYLETQFYTKKKRYLNLRKDLIEKQKNATELYTEMSQLREKLVAKGGKDPGKVEPINLTSGGTDHLPRSRSSEGHQQLDGSGERVSGGNVPLTNEFLSTIISKIRELPKRFFELCSEMLHQRTEIISSLIKIENSKEIVEMESAIAKELESLNNETVSLESRVEGAQKINETSITETIEKLSTLWSELESSNEKILQFESNQAGVNKETSVKLDNAIREKKLAEVECARLKERELSLESELQKLRTKLRETEARIGEGDQKITRLQNHVKSLESQFKQKDSNADKQLKDLEKSLKSSQSLLSKTEKQRECLESKLVELKKQLGSKEKESENKIKQISIKLTAANLELAKLREERVDATTDKNASPDRTDRRLAERDKKIKTLQRQKQEIIRAVDPGFFGDKCDLEFGDDNETHSEFINLLKKSIGELRVNSEKQQEKIESLKRQLDESLSSEGRGHLKYVDKPFTAHRVKDLEKQVEELRLSHRELSRRNEQLVLMLNHKEREIERQDRIIKERGNVMKVRDEVIGLVTENTKLRDKSLDGHRAVTKKACHFREREQVDRQIAQKSENLEELYSSLEAKQMQISQLEQLVEDMEIQQERAQEQRTRLEKKIAQLQVTLHCRKGQHRSRCWLSSL